MERKTIFPKGFFGKQEEKVDRENQELIKKLPFWECIAKKSEISENTTVFIDFFYVPKNICFYNWFKMSSTCKCLYQYVAYMEGIKEKDIIIKTETETIVDENSKISAITDSLNQRKRLSLVVDRFNKIPKGKQFYRFMTK